jgi:hypothetical protein
MIPLFVLPILLLVVLASPTSGDQHFRESLHYADHHPIRIEDERERLVTAFPVMSRNWGPSWVKPLPGEQPRETAET